MKHSTLSTQVATELRTLAEQAVEMARRAGANDAEAVAFECDEIRERVGALKSSSIACPGVSAMCHSSGIKGSKRSRNTLASPVAPAMITVRFGMPVLRCNPPIKVSMIAARRKTATARRRMA